MAVKKVVIAHMRRADLIHPERLWPGHIGPGRRRTRVSSPRSNAENIFRFSPVWLISIYKRP